MRTLVWFRGKDLRVTDHLPLLEAAANGEVIPLFVVDPYFFAPERAAELPHRMQFLTDSLAELSDRIAELGSRLVVVAGKSVDIVPKIAHALKVDRVVGYRWTEPVGRERDKHVTGRRSAPSRSISTKARRSPRQGRCSPAKGEPFSVFGPFARAFAKAVQIDPPKPAPRRLPPLPKLPSSVRCILVPGTKELGIVRNDGIVAGGEKAAHERLRRFLEGAAAHYETGRSAIGEDGTSRLSQDLKFGTLSVRAVWTAADEALVEHPKARRTFSNELVWRELAYHVLWHRPSVLTAPFRDAWRRFPFKKNKKGWEAWVKGTTGYPVVDAAARQLLSAGFVHNRARMIAASFLTKHLLVDFRLGEAHYMKWLTDGDWASNDLGWQWSTGCGVDAQPWFRVFNPTLQGEKFDPEGEYVRRWLPELRDVPAKLVHRPWEYRGKLAYPQPIIDHDFARKRFLATAKSHLG